MTRATWEAPKYLQMCLKVLTIPSHRWEWDWGFRGWRGKEGTFLCNTVFTFSILQVCKKVKIKNKPRTFKKIILFLGLCCVFVTARAVFSSSVSRVSSLAVVCGLLIAVPSLTMECRLQGAWASVVAACWLSSCASGLESTGSTGVACRLSCSTARGTFLDQGSNLCLPALAGGFFPTEPPGKPLEHLRKEKKNFFFPLQRQKIRRRKWMAFLVRCVTIYMN